MLPRKLYESYKKSVINLKIIAKTKEDVMTALTLAITGSILPHMAIVVDEYGEIEGLISVEDIFKEITGKFGGDKEELEREFIKLKDGSILTDGNSKIRDLNNYVNWEIPETSSKTINGLITEYLDQIPQANLCIEIDNYRFEILELDENLISKIKIKKGANAP